MYYILRPHQVKFNVKVFFITYISLHISSIKLEGVFIVIT